MRGGSDPVHIAFAESKASLAGLWESDIGVRQDIFSNRLCVDGISLVSRKGPKFGSDITLSAGAITADWEQLSGGVGIDWK
jgi:hypothetical protein